MSTQAQIDARSAALEAARVSFNAAVGQWNPMAAALNAALPALRSDGGADPQPLVDALNAIVSVATAAITPLHADIDAAAAMVASDPPAAPTNLVATLA